MQSILFIEDDPVSLKVTETALKKWGYSVHAADSAEAAWEYLKSNPRPAMMIVDWQLPGISGPEFCKQVRETACLKDVYIMMLTSSAGRENMLEGLQAGADDYLEKPVDARFLEARVKVGERIVTLQSDLESKVAELQEALTNVKELRGLLPICSYCKKIRNDGNYWERLESYLSAHTHAQFSHSICPDCYDSVVKQEIENFKNNQE